MIDWAAIVGFDWDDGNRVKSVVKHDVGSAEGEQAFFNEPLIVMPDARHSSSERRFHALGRTNAGRHLFVVFTLRANETLIRVISARDMNRKERKAYGSDQT